MPHFSCPPLIIAEAALERVVPGAHLALPKDWNRGSLMVAALEFNYPYKEVNIGPAEAKNYAQLGQAILDLNTKGKIQPPLNQAQEASIKHLLKVVNG